MWNVRPLFMLHWCSPGFFEAYCIATLLLLSLVCKHGLLTSTDGWIAAGYSMKKTEKKFKNQVFRWTVKVKNTAYVPVLTIIELQKIVPYFMSTLRSNLNLRLCHSSFTSYRHIQCINKLHVELQLLLQSVSALQAVFLLLQPRASPLEILRGGLHRVPWKHVVPAQRLRSHGGDRRRQGDSLWSY